MKKYISNLFVSHGSPMNALADNNYTKTLNKIGLRLKPAAIVVVSAHWFTKGKTQIQYAPINRTIHDFGGFPRELFECQYNAPGSMELVKKILKNIPEIEPTDRWGLDHGAWTVLKHMYPLADIPVVQVSINTNLNMKEHYELAKRLDFLSEENVMLIGSGNVSHNLAFVNFGIMSDQPSTAWALDLNKSVNQAIEKNQLEYLFDYKKLPGAAIGIASNDHYIPLLYALGASHQKKKKEWFYRGFELGTLSMDCIEFCD